MAAERNQLTGGQKAAILMSLLGPEICANVFKHLSDDEIEHLTLEIANLRDVDGDATHRVLQESHDALYDALTVHPGKLPFAAARELDPSHLLYLVMDEHPQTIALILAHLPADQAAHILAGIPEERQVEVARRLATLDRTPREILSEVDAALQERISTSRPAEYVDAGGVDAVVDVINFMDQAAKRSLLERLELHDPGLAEKIRHESLPFDDLEHFDDDDVQRIVAAVTEKVWAFALKTAGEGVTERVLRNTPRRSAERLRAAIDDLGPVRLRDVEAAQNEVVRVVRDLQRAGEILMVKTVEDELIV